MVAEYAEKMVTSPGSVLAREKKSVSDVNKLVTGSLTVLNRVS